MLVRVNVFNINCLRFFNKGLTPVEVSEGFQMALDKTLELLPTLVCYEIKNVKNYDQQRILARAVKYSIMSKQYGQEQFITDLVLKACSKYDDIINYMIFFLN